MAKSSKTRARNKSAKANKQKAARLAQRDHAALESLAQKRRPFEPLLQQVVAAVLHAAAPLPAGDAAPPSRRDWIEVGSGLGQLRGLLPLELRDRVIHTELSDSLVRGLIEKHAGARALAADVTALPFDSASLDVVLGLCAFDSFPDQAKAATEIGRVLREGGRFIHFLDAATNIEPIFERLIVAGRLPLPNFFADIALRRPDLVRTAPLEHLLQPYHDVLSVPAEQFLAVTEMLTRAGHRLAAMLQRYAAPFATRPFEALPAARAFVRLTSDPVVGRPLNQALMSLVTTLQQPPYSDHVPFELTSHSSLAFFESTLQHYFGPRFGFEVRLSKIVYARSYHWGASDPLRARVRRVGIGQNSVDWPMPEGIPAQRLMPQLPSSEPGDATSATHLLREAAIHCLVAEKRQAPVG